MSLSPIACFKEKTNCWHIIGVSLDGMMMKRNMILLTVGCKILLFVIFKFHPELINT